MAWFGHEHLKKGKRYSTERNRSDSVNKNSEFASFYGFAQPTTAQLLTADGESFILRVCLRKHEEPAGLQDWTGSIINQVMASSEPIARLCKVCSKLNIQRFTHPLHPCHDPLPCSTPPIEGAHATFFPLGSIDEIKGRRFTCGFCNLIAESLDKEPSDLNGECSVRETEEFCNFKLPIDVKGRDPSMTHFHLTQLSVLYYPPIENRFHGPSLPWEFKERDAWTSHYIQTFQVKARSCADSGDPTAAFLQTEQEFLDTIGGRYVSTQVNVQLLRAWLHQCESEHGDVCVPSLRLPVERNGETGFQPTFVVDVTQSCLVDTPSHCRYVALSYVWGIASAFRHLLENTRDLRKKNSLHSFPIPATIRDAITLVRAIGERYLWVDSLCIIQDDSKMQQAEMMRMGSIYSKALFTIIAAAGDHANRGLPGVEQGSREQVQKILKLADCELLTVIDIRNRSNRIDDTTWAERAWTFQERVLSSRVLVFSETQAYWNCRAASHSEERALEQVRDIHRCRLSFPQQPVTDSLSWERLQPLEYCDIYRGLLSSYRQRHLTYHADMLNAFNGVSEILGTLQDDIFHWGLPQSHFSYAITWAFTGPSSRNYVDVPVFDNDGSKQMISIPSWSWAAWSGADLTRTPFLRAGDDIDVRPVVHFHIVDEKYQLVVIKDRPMQDHPGDFVPTSWKNGQPHQFQPLTQLPVTRIGQLHFWTSLANLRVIRHWSAMATGSVHYILFPSPNFERDTHSTYEIVDQDFIVVAARDPGELILLAVEWRDGVAYRVGITDVEEVDWLRVETREWRLITLG
ncbi:heterokaryon incompatibility protein-domain-containing protein [Butyriboletus roseoflavus]|nr:heterokaryon incompatibility protein-domain-containing protein [Butyriboletus roseoflavus]